MCEGKRDEKHYVDSLRTRLRLSAANLIVESANGGSPSSIVDAAISRTSTFGRGSAEALDEAWVLLDAEEADRSGIKSAVDRAISTGICVAVSNPCFEIWLLLHANDCGAYLSATQAKQLLESELGIPGPRKVPAAFDDARLKENWRAAAIRAENRRRRIVEDEGLDADQNPCRVVLAGNPATCVDRLIPALLSGRRQ
jgi:RloB-like protein